jgi:hypothetical protein
MIHRRVRAVAGWLVALLVFAQGAVAANACLAANSARVDAVAAATHEGCEMQERNLNLCVYHCADQYNNGGGSPQIIVLAPAPSAPPAAFWSEAVPATEAASTVGRATGPPIPIRHCRLHI